jgi:high-affinity iron transporter
MTDSQLFATYLIGLREGLEGTLVVSILIAFLVKSQRRHLLPHVFVGVGAAIAISVGFGALLTYTQTTLLRDYRHQELFDAVTSVTAVCFVTWMIFWMRRAARSVAGDLRAGLDQAISVGPFAVVGFAFLAVAREGLETALLFFSAVQGATTSAKPLLAIIGGIGTSVLIGFLLYAGAMRVNLGRFFTWTGALLVLVAAGIFKYGVHDFQEARVLPGINDIAFDIHTALAPDSWYGALVRGMFNITPQPTVLEVIAWLAYAIPVLTIFLIPARRSAPIAAKPAESAAKPDEPKPDSAQPEPAARRTEPEPVEARPEPAARRTEPENVEPEPAEPAEPQPAVARSRPARPSV